ncbi:hypothetical protein ACWDRX_31950, partial [Streptomyces nigra]
MIDNSTTSATVLEQIRRRPAKERRILFTGATIITMDPVYGVIDHGDLLIEGDTITAVGHDLTAADDAVTVDATGTILSPGFVDAHRHAWETQLRRSVSPRPGRRNSARGRCRPAPTSPCSR